MFIDKYCPINYVNPITFVMYIRDILYSVLSSSLDGFLCHVTGMRPWTAPAAAWPHSARCRPRDEHLQLDYSIRRFWIYVSSIIKMKSWGMTVFTFHLVWEISKQFNFIVSYIDYKVSWCFVLMKFTISRKIITNYYSNAYQNNRN